jgi:uncharacterized protein Yka (UPF0111/DUF47 family)
MTKRRWFLPDSPDVLAQLRTQASITLEGLEAFAAWAAGDEQAEERLTEIEGRADAAKRELLGEIRDAFVTPIEPEDLFTLSRGLDWILDYSRDLASEAKALSSPPDARLAEMSELLLAAMRHIDEAIGQLGSDPDAATGAADEAIEAERRLEQCYYEGMAELLRVDARDERISSRELYRRCARIGDQMIDVAERIVYSVVKES